MTQRDRRAPTAPETTGAPSPAPSHSAAPPATRRALAEWEADALVRLATRGAGAEGDERLLDWLARDLRARQGERERLRADELADDFARRAQGRIAAARIARGCPVRALRDRLPAARGTVEQVGAIAAADRCAPWLDLGVAAGVGRELWDEPCERWVELPDDAPPGRYVALTVSGDSMTPLLESGDVILVRLGAEVRPESVVVARHPEDGYVVKRVARLTKRRVELASLNAAYPAIRIARDARLIVGEVVARGRRERVVPAGDA
jgi:hypothetical protein